MRVVVSKQFLKDLKKLPKNFRSRIEIFVFQSLKNINSIEEIKNLKKLSGNDNAYRIRFGDYRLGLFFENGSLMFTVIGARGDFYKKFP